MKKINHGFTFIEVLVGSAIFLIVAIAVYSSFTSLVQLANGNQSRTMAVQLAAEQFEIIRNMPYASIGLTNGIPLGVLSQDQILTRGGVTYNVHLTVRNINLSTSTIQASDKLVEINVDCPNCQNFEAVKLTGQISPANLQSAGNGGALVVQVFNGNGEPVSGATVNVQSVATSTVQNTDTTNNDGLLNIIGVPSGVNMYKIIVTKNGYSTEETYELGAVGNPNPTKPNVTVLNQQVSQVSFAIDRLSSLHFSSVTPLCVPVGNIDFSLRGAKNIGSNVSKYFQNLATNSSGILDIPSMEWDTYDLTPTDTGYDIAGINPDNPFSLNPDNSQNVQLIVVPKNLNSLMISVYDNASRLPISGATVNLSRSGYDKSLTTGQGYLNQDDWSQGSGQDMYINQSQYFGDNGSVDVATSSGDVVLRDFFGSYNIGLTGTLESSTFDTGTSSNFHSLFWTPNNQPVLAGASSFRVQFASNSSTTDVTWDFLGPDGTSGTYYDVSGSPISNVHNNNRYVRYKAYLNTETATVTPKLSSIFFAYTSGCIPPGQVLFQGLTAGTYNLSVSKTGYTTISEEVEVTSGWQSHTVPLVSE